jgi:hypothetical protein
MILGVGIGVILAGMITTTLGYFGNAPLTQYVGELIVVSGIAFTVIGNYLKSTMP